jgi:very-short-patch-repair endonuclease
MFTRREARVAGISDRRLERAVERGTYVRLAQGVYFKGDREPALFERRLAQMMRSGKPVGGELGAALHGMDGFEAPSDGNYKNIATLEPNDTLLSIAATTSDIVWEQALEWCLRKQHITISEIEAALAKHRKGNGRMRRVLKLRPDGAGPTGSLLETHAVQLIRRSVAIPTPSRQVNVRHWHVDLAWPEHGVFLELDGEWHKDQARYDAVRQTGVIAAKGWLVGRFTWSDIVYSPTSTLRSITALFEARKLLNTR